MRIFVHSSPLGERQRWKVRMRWKDGNDHSGMCHHGDPPAAPPVGTLGAHLAPPCSGNAGPACAVMLSRPGVVLDKWLWSDGWMWWFWDYSRCFHVQGVEFRCPGACGCSGNWVWLLDEAGQRFLFLTLHSSYFQVSVPSFSCISDLEKPLCTAVPAPKVCGPSLTKALSQEIQSDVAFWFVFTITHLSGHGRNFQFNLWWIQVHFLLLHHLRAGSRKVTGALTDIKMCLSSSCVPKTILVPL